jgi:hypothetical protein
MRAATTMHIINFQYHNNNTKHMTDCLINKEQITMLVQGPATRALERSSKRQRISSGRRQESIGSESDDSVSTFSWQHVFQTLAPEEEAFPIIGWDSDEESTEPGDLSDKTQRELGAVWDSLIGKKRSSATMDYHSCGLLRSKSFKFDLAHQSPMGIPNNGTFPSCQLTQLEKSLYILSSVLPRNASLSTILAKSS